MDRRVDYLMTRNIDALGSEFSGTPPTAEVLIGQSLDRELRSFAIYSEKTLPDLEIEWDLLQTATSRQREQVILTGVWQGSDARNLVVEYPAAGTPGYQRTLMLRLRERSTDQAKDLTRVFFSLQFEQKQTPAAIGYEAGPGTKEAEESMGIARGRSQAKFSKIKEEG